MAKEQIKQWQRLAGSLKADGDFGDLTLARSVEIAELTGLELPAPPKPPAWTLGARSLSRLEGVDPGLVAVVKAAVEVAGGPAHERAAEAIAGIRCNPHAQQPPYHRPRR